MSCPRLNFREHASIGVSPGVYWPTETIFSAITSRSKSKLLSGFSGAGYAAEAATVGTKLHHADTIAVHADAENLPLETPSIKISGKTIEASAGTFGDLSRFLQTMPGVASGNDQRNDLLVRGGNPAENLFVIDGIPVPNLNQLALSDTTGGFVSMIDNEAVESLTFMSGVHDAQYDDRLSSVVAISTVPDRESQRRSVSQRSVEAGIAGVGFVQSRPLGRDHQSGSMLVAVRRSVLNLLTNDIGMNGVPIYTNSVLRADDSLTPHDKVWGMSLSGLDSIKIRPSATDVLETNPFNIDYHGWRDTFGLNWQHILSARTYFAMTISNAEQAQSIQQYDQLSNNALSYSEDTHDGTSRLAVELGHQVSSSSLLRSGFEQTATRISYTIQQPIVVPTPYSTSPDPDEATSVADHFTTGSSSAWTQAHWNLNAKVSITAGTRYSFWSFGAHTALTPRASMMFPLGKLAVSIGYSESAQMPSFLYLLAFSQNRNLTPIRGRQWTVDTRILERRGVRLNLAAYDKHYADYPVAATFPQLSMANIADTFGQSFLMFPMASKGTGHAYGTEMSLQSRLGQRIRLAATATYSRAWYAGLDGVLRRADIDLPLSSTLTSEVNLKSNLAFSIRYTATSGRPYTPDDSALSLAQNREVYDLSRLNSLRSPSYQRLDIRMQGSRKLKHGSMLWNAGLLNCLNNQNFYSYEWQPRLALGGGAGSLSEQKQIPLFPEGSIRYSF